MPHLTPDEIERRATAPAHDEWDGPGADHLATCARCREDVELTRALVAHLAESPRTEPSTGFADAVMARVALPLPWLERKLARMASPAPSPGFAAGVMGRVRLPAPWYRRIASLARRRRTALVATAAGTVSIMGAFAGWLFGAQGLAPSQVLSGLLGGAGDLAVRALLAAGRAGYRLGLLDAGGSMVDAISPLTALGSLALAGALGLCSLWAMARLSRGRPRPAPLARAA